PCPAIRLLFSDSTVGCSGAVSACHPHSWSLAALHDFTLAGTPHVAGDTQEAFWPSGYTEALRCIPSVDDAPSFAVARCCLRNRTDGSSRDGATASLQRTRNAHCHLHRAGGSPHRPQAVGAIARALASQRLLRTAGNRSHDSSLGPGRRNGRDRLSGHSDEASRKNACWLSIDDIRTAERD